VRPIIAAPMRFLPVLAALPLVAADPVLDDLRAANQARAELAREQAAATAERQRLEALIAATVAENARVRARAEAVENANRAQRRELDTLAAAGDAGALRARLEAAGADLLARLDALAATSLPGVVARGEVRGFSGAVQVLEQAERAAAQVVVEVVTGERGGVRQAVKLLRVANAAAWWVSLDGRAAGSARMQAGGLQLEELPPDRAAPIHAALAQAEGRAQPRVELLPGMTP
jgi:hypothetical protein